MEIDTLFLDRDGTLNVERADYVRCREQMVLLPGVLPALRRLAALHVPIVLITNQSAIGRGLVEAAAVDGLHAELRSVIAAHGGRIDGVYVCPHAPDAGCGCRKPRPGLLRLAAADLGVALERCLLIGDSISDALAARSAGCHCILVKTGRQGDMLDGWRASSPAGREVTVVDTLADAARIVCSQMEWMPIGTEYGT